VQKPTTLQIEIAYHGTSQLISIIFFIADVFHIRHEKRLGDTLKLPRTETLESLGSFKVSASVSEAATFRLGLGSEDLVHIPADKSFSLCDWKSEAGFRTIAGFLVICFICSKLKLFCVAIKILDLSSEFWRNNFLDKLKTSARVYSERSFA